MRPIGRQSKAEYWHENKVWILSSIILILVGIVINQWRFPGQ